MLSLFWWAIFVVLGCLYSVGRTCLVCYLYYVGLSVFWWAVFILVGYLYSGGLSVFWWAICILVGYHLYSGGMPIVCHYFSCGQSTEIGGLTIFGSILWAICPHFAQHILQNVCFIELPCQP